jgi:hypothetical protein
VDLAAILLLGLALRPLELLGGRPVPGQDVGARLGHVRQLEPQADALALAHLRAEHSRLLGVALPPFEIDRLRPLPLRSFPAPIKPAVLKDDRSKRRRHSRHGPAPPSSPAALIHKWRIFFLHLAHRCVTMRRK